VELGQKRTLQSLQGVEGRFMEGVPVFMTVARHSFLNCFKAYIFPVALNLTRITLPKLPDKSWDIITWDVS